MVVIWRVGRDSRRPVTFCAAIHGTRVNWRRPAELDAALVASRPAPAGPELAAAIRARRRRARSAARSGIVPVLVPRRPSPAVRWAAVLGTPPWAALAAGLVAFVLGALVGASDGALVSVADPPDAATWIEAGISAAAGDIEWEVLR